ncbi:MAG: hypothetical protein SWH68_01490 [Thermodesulfobacteriota bacterium]|nr:hypothetical protein [Thermodesulfobacteriota bacterium]
MRGNLRRGGDEWPIVQYLHHFLWSAVRFRFILINWYQKEWPYEYEYWKERA